MAKERDFFLENLSLMIHAGMPVYQAVGSIKEEIKSPKVRKAVEVVETELHNGLSFSQALEKSGLVPPRLLPLIQLGEETGDLSGQLSLIVAQEKKERTFEHKIRSALLYPGFVLMVTLGVSIVTIWYTFPKLVTVFENIGGTLPLSTRIIISVGNFFTAFGLIVVPLVLLVLGLTFFFLFIYPRTKIAGERLLMSLPVANRIIQELELARFGYMLGTLLHAGVSVPQALRSLGSSTPFLMYKNFYESVEHGVIEGESVHSAIAQSPNAKKFIPPHISGLLLAGESSGALSDTLLSISSIYEEKTENLTRDIGALLEPVIIIFVGIIVLLITVGIITPIYGLTENLGV